MIHLKSILFSSIFLASLLGNWSLLSAAPQSQFIRGDSNANGHLELSDVILLLQHLFQGAEINCLSSGDLDGDDTINLTDPIQSLKFQFLGGVIIPSPYPHCGQDLHSNLGCNSHGSCPNIEEPEIPEACDLGAVLAGEPPPLNKEIGRFEFEEEIDAGCETCTVKYVTLKSNPVEVVTGQPDFYPGMLLPADPHGASSRFEVVVDNRPSIELVLSNGPLRVATRTIENPSFGRAKVSIAQMLAEIGVEDSKPIAYTYQVIEQKSNSKNHLAAELNLDLPWFEGKRLTD